MAECYAGRTMHQGQSRGIEPEAERLPADAAQLPRGGHAHVQHEQHQRALEQLEIHGIDFRDAVFSGQVADGHAADQQQCGFTGQHFPDLMPANAIAAFGQCEADQDGRNFQGNHECDQHGIGWLAAAFGELLRGDESYCGHRAEVCRHGGGIKTGIA